MNLETRKTVALVVLAMTYIMALLLFFLFSVKMGGGGDGQVLWIILYVALSLPSSLLVVISFAFPIVSIPLILVLAPTLNVVVVLFIRWIRHHRRSIGE